MTNTNIWQKAWFRKLSPENKLFLKYIWERSSHAGIIDLDQELFEFEMGTPLNLEKSLEILSEHIEQLPNGKLFVIDRVRVNQKELNPNCKPHIPIIEELKRYGLLERVSKPLVKGTSNSNSNSNSNSKETKPKANLTKREKTENPKLEAWGLIQPIFGIKKDAYYQPDISKALDNLLAKYELPQIKRGVEGRRLADRPTKEDKEITSFLRWGIGKYIDAVVSSSKPDKVEVYCVHCDKKTTDNRGDMSVCCGEVMLGKNDYEHEKVRLVRAGRNGTGNNGGRQGVGLQKRTIQKQKTQRSGDLGIDEVIGTLTNKMEKV